MWVEVKPITVDDAPELSKWIHVGLDELTLAIAQSRPAISYWVSEGLIAMVGFVPMALITGTAYAWMQWTPLVEKYKTVTGRLGILTIREIRKYHYQRIVGHCTNEQQVRWLKSMGARFQPGHDPNAAVYMIGE